MSNIIVYGVRRTGTSLMVTMISKNENYTISDDNEFKDELKSIQPYFNEGPFVDGIDNNNKEIYNKLSKNVIKFLNIGLLITPIEYFDTFSKIIIMNRNWVSQNKSIKNLYNINAKLVIKEQNLNLDNTQQFLDDYAYDDGIEYGYYYSYIVIDILKRNYKSKVIFVNFEDLMCDLNKVNKVLKFHNLGIDKSYNSVDKKVSKYYEETITRENLKEFKKGYFNYLDTLYNCIRFNIIDNDLLKSIQYWLPYIENNIKLREIRIFNKYNINLSTWLEKSLKEVLEVNNIN